MKNKTLLVLVAVASVFLSSCAKRVYYTENVRKNLEEVGINPSDLQFYNDKKIVLRRDLDIGSTTVQSGKIKNGKGKKISFLILKPKTPGVCKSYAKDELKIAFEDGEEKVLTFKNLTISDRRTDYALDIPSNQDKVKVMYGGHAYTLYKEGKGARLLIKKDDADRVRVEKHRMKGLRVQK